MKQFRFIWTFVMLIMIAAGCANNPSNTSSSGSSSSAGGILVQSSVQRVSFFSSDYIMTTVYDEGGAYCSSAVLYVNGVAQPYAGSSGLYGTNMSMTSGYALTIRHGDLNVTNTNWMPQVPTILSPVGSTRSASQPLTVVWNPVTPAPGYFIVSIPSNFTVSGAVYSVTISGTNEIFVIPANTLKSWMTNATIIVASMNSNNITASGIASGSYFAVMNPGYGSVTTTN